MERTQLGGQLHTYIYIINIYIYMYMIIFIIHLIFGTYTDIRSFNYLHKVSSLSTLVHETQNIPKRLSDQPTTSCFWEVMKQAYIYSAATAPFYRTSLKKHRHMLPLASTPFAGSSRLEYYGESFVNDQSPIPPFHETNAFEGTNPTSKYMFVFCFPN